MNIDMHKMNSCDLNAKLPTFSEAHWQELLNTRLTITTDRINGMFYGLALGDALGLPVETMLPDEIRSKYGKISSFVSNPTHKWYGNLAPGTWSDDTQLTIAVANALTTSGFSIPALKHNHILAADQSTVGWGSTTRNAVQRFREVKDSTSFTEKQGNQLGTGNGVIMKLSPLALWLLKHSSLNEVSDALDLFTNLTHPTPLARTATHALCAAFMYVASCSPDSFQHAKCVEYCVAAAASRVADDPSNELLQRLKELRNFSQLNMDETIKRWGGGGCYVLDSLPVCLLVFLNEFSSFDAVLTAVNIGGDTDSNASIVGALIGLLNGEKILSSELISQIQNIKFLRQTIKEFTAKIS